MNFSKIDPPQRASINESMNQPHHTLHALLIPEATNREPTSLTVVGIVHIAVVHVQEDGPGGRSIEPSRTPPVPIDAKAAE